jgi:peptide/nickel transport system ATP-binding protein
MSHSLLTKGKVLGIVGESGCGKSITSLSILRLIPPPGKIVGGQIRLDGKNLLEFSRSANARRQGQSHSS